MQQTESINTLNNLPAFHTDYENLDYFKETEQSPAKRDDTAISWLPAQEKQISVCICCFGGIRNIVQAALLFPHYKSAGYHVTAMTTPKGKDILRHDPNIDDWFILDMDQIHNNFLHTFWQEQAKRFKQFINLLGSIEGYLLALPGRPNHSWPHEVRKKRLNLNYHEWTAELAGVPFKPAKLFYPAVAEAEKMTAFKDSACPESQAPAFTILWALSGSSLHTFSPHMDTVISRILLEIPEARIFMAGDLACQLLEQGWENEPRVVCLSDKLTIRESLTLAQLVNLVIGPESGVMDAISMDESPHKVLMLSHSSKNNLSKHWKNTLTLIPDNCECWPCHRLHYNAEYCSQDHHTGAAKCAVNIGPGKIWTAVKRVYKTWKTNHALQNRIIDKVKSP